jgi:hypothetical protein
MNLKNVFDHIARHATLYAMVLMLIVGVLLGSWARMAVHRCPEPPKCPELVARSHVERDSIGPPKDTVRVVKRPPAISTIITPSRDTTKRSIVTWNIVDTMPDRVVIGVAVSSGWLPMPMPLDLVFDVRYLAVPDKIKIKSDTLTVQLPPLACPSRWQREVVIGGICLGVGAIAATAYFTFR